MYLPPILRDLTEGEDCPSLEQASELFSMLTPQEMKKNEILQDMGVKCRRMFFIKSGIVKSVILDDEGAYQTVRFIGAGDGITVADSFINQNPSTVRLQCVSPGEILSLKHDDYLYMIRLYKGLGPAFLKLMLERKTKQLRERHLMIHRDAATRYLKFKESYEAIFKQLPLKDVSSYLGIRQQSLSRLRAKL